MKELAIMFASVISTDELINQLEDTISKYRLDSSQDNLAKIQTVCMLVMTKTITDKNDPLEFIKEMDKIERIAERMESKQ